MNPGESMDEPTTSTGHFVKGFHEERTEEPQPHPILGAYYRQGWK